MQQLNLYAPTPEPPAVSEIVPPTSIVLSQYRHPDERVSESEIFCQFREAHVSSRPKDHPCYQQQDKYWFWDVAIDCGRSYMVGDTPLSKYLRRYSSPLTKWQRWAYMWAIENPDKILFVETRSHYWRIYLRGEYVEFALPFQDRGGERNYVTRNGKSKVLVNED